MFRNVQMVLAGLIAVVWVLALLARRYPHVGWLRPFRDAWPRVSEEQRAKQRRRADVLSGAQMILAGVMLPLGYLALKVMFLSAFPTIEVAGVMAASVLLITLGITAIVRARR